MILPYGRQYIDDDDVAAVVAVLRSDYLTTGPVVEKFETALGARVGAKYAIACSSGTAALHLAAMALGLGAGDTTVVPSMTFMATANAARLTGAEIIFADVDPETGLMQPGDLERALKSRSGGKLRAVFPVHINGQTADVARLGDIARACGSAVVEDAAHAIGTSVEDAAGLAVPVGRCHHSSMTAFSFHAIKTVTQGEGGAITTNDDALAARLRRLRNHGISREPNDIIDVAAGFDSHGKLNPWYHEMKEPGLNYRASDIHCALGLSQFGKLDHFVARRLALAERYDALLKDLAPVVRPVPRVGKCAPAWHLYSVLIDFGALKIERSKVMQKLREKGIGTQVHYIPVHRQPYYRQRYGALDLPGADAYYQRQLSLPLFPAMKDEDVERVVDGLTSIVRQV
jgi:UDP-4-amino-4,6-dideoxy-N-acetyl-beta-L-altrosamine transaminase